MTEEIEKALVELLEEATDIPVFRWAEISDRGGSRVVVQCNTPKPFVISGSGKAYAWQVETFITCFTHLVEDADKSTMDSVIAEIWEEVNSWTASDITGTTFTVDGVLSGDSTADVQGNYHSEVTSINLIVRETKPTT